VAIGKTLKNVMPVQPSRKKPSAKKSARKASRQVSKTATQTTATRTTTASATRASSKKRLVTKGARPAVRTETVGVYKFGGAALADARAFKRATKIVEAAPGPVAVVCSAPFGVTNLLLKVSQSARSGDAPGVEEGIKDLRIRFRDILKGLRLPAASRTELATAIKASLEELESMLRGLLVLRELTPRTSDLIVSRGEQLGAQLFAAALDAAGVKAAYADPFKFVVTKGPFGGAAPDLPATDRRVRTQVLPLMEDGLVPVVAGFLGVFDPGNGEPPAIATLGRGGSDLTATLIARGLKASRVSLWKDVAGLLTAHPQVVPDARVIPQLNLREAAELAYYGAKVLHPRALIPVAGKQIAVHVRPFSDPESLGTEISARHTLDKYPVKALSAANGQALVTVAGRGLIGVPGIAARAFAVLSDNGLSVSLISQSSSEQTICFTVPEDEATIAGRLLEDVFAREIERREVDGIQVQPGMATIAVVGLGMAGHVGIAARVFAALSTGSINIVAIAQGSSELNISFVVRQDQAEHAQRLIHEAFQLSKIGGGALRGDEHVDVVLLGFGQIGRTLATMIAGNRVKKQSNRSPFRVVAAIDRTGFVFEPEGFSGPRAAELSQLKQNGTGLAQVPGGHKGSPSEAIDYLVKHALSRPVVADVTAHDTTAILHAALRGGMDIVLANKRPLSGPRDEHDELRQMVVDLGRKLRFEATVGAGLPILDTYRKLVESGDKVLKIEGCVSGTLGYLLTALGRGTPFSKAVTDAMEAGFTEPDPRDDLSGMDVGRKALILGRLLGYSGGPEDIKVESLVPKEAEGMSRNAFLAKLPSWDRAWEARVQAAKDSNKVLRYVASVTAKGIIVGLQKVPRSSPFASLEGTDNQIAFTTTRYRSPMVITGAGAGLEVTAGGVFNDIIDLIE